MPGEVVVAIALSRRRGACGRASFAQPEPLGQLAPAAGVIAHGGAQCVTFREDQRRARPLRCVGAWQGNCGALRERLRQMRDVDDAFTGEQGGALDDIAQLAHVARVSIALQRAPGCRCQAASRARQPPQHRFGQQQDIQRTVPQRRHDDREGADAVVEIGPERARVDELAQVTMRCRDEPEVGPLHLRAADAAKQAGLQYAQQLDLQRQRDVADLVDEQRAAGGGLDQSQLARGSRR